ncbi:RHS repeat-associated core domain-containing protein, partial [Chiayiivirga flava]
GYTGHHERKQFGATAAGISGLIDMHTRYYDPAAMQFLQPDSIVPDVYQPLSWNRRTYVNNSPVMFSDPTGMAPQLQESQAQTAERKGMELDEFADNRGFGYSNGGGLGSAPTGTQAGDLLAGMRARKVAGAHMAHADKSLGEKTVAEMSNEEKFWYNGYRRDANNYRIAGMRAPFETVEEYIVWRAFSMEAQAMGMNSQMMEDMALRADTAADVVGFGAANPMKRGGISASSFKSWMANLLRLGRVSPEVAAAARQVARQREARALDLAAANHKGLLWFGAGERAGQRVLRMYGDEIGSELVFFYNGRFTQIVSLDAKYATVENAKAVWEVMQRDLRKQAPAVTLDFSFDGNLDAAREFASELRKNIGAFRPTNVDGFRNMQRVEVGHTYFGSESGGAMNVHTHIRIVDD